MVSYYNIVYIIIVNIYLRMSTKLIDNTKALMGIAFILGVGASPLIKILRKLLTKKPKAPIQEKVYVGIEIGGTNFAVAIGVPNYDEHGHITSFTLRNQMTGKTDLSP
jgi:hypothetical protein